MGGQEGLAFIRQAALQRPGGPCRPRWVFQAIQMTQVTNKP